MDLKKSLSWVFSISNPEPLKSFGKMDIEDTIKISGEIVLFCHYLSRVNSREISKACTVFLRNLYYSLNEKHSEVFDPRYHFNFIIIYRLFYEHGLHNDSFTKNYIRYFKKFDFYDCELPQWELFGIQRALKVLDRELVFEPYPLDIDEFFKKNSSDILLDENAYALTHIVMYLSDFGNNEINKGKWLEFFKNNIDNWLIEYANIGNTDIVCELMITSFHLKHTIRFDWKDYLQRNQKTAGYFVTSNEKVLSLSQQNQYLKYYHTTYVAIIAILLMKTN